MDASLWGLDANDKDHLVSGGCDLVELAKAYGTPLHVLDESKLRGNCRSFLNAFRDAYQQVKIFYSYKTNCIPGVLKIVHEEGCGAEVESPYELWLAAQLVDDPSKIVYNGVNKSEEALKAAIQTGVGLINVDSVGEIRRLKKVADELKTEINIGIRISPRVGWRAQFGLLPKEDEVLQMCKELDEASFLNLCCLHVHIGTSIRSTEVYKKAIEEICLLIHQLNQRLSTEIKYFDLGGGFGVPTVRPFTLLELGLHRILNIPPAEPDVKKCPSVDMFGRVITDVLKKCCAQYRIKEPCLLLEPGRILAGNAQTLLVTVTNLKERNGVRYALTDGGQNIAYPLLYEYHKCFLVNRISTSPEYRYFVTGLLSTPSDILFRNLKLPELKEGDILAIMDSGAYFSAFSYNFSHPRAAVVLVSDGSHRLIRKRESFEHMKALDAV